MSGGVDGHDYERDCRLPGHLAYLEVDDQDWLYVSCHYPSGAYHGDAFIIGQAPPEVAEAVRRAARAFREGRGPRPGLGPLSVDRTR